MPTVEETKEADAKGADETEETSIAEEAEEVTTRGTEETSVAEDAPAIETTKDDSETVYSEEGSPAIKVESEEKGKQQAQALLTAGMAGVTAKAFPATDNGEVSAVEYAEAQKAQLGIAKPAVSSLTPKTIAKATAKEEAAAISKNEMTLDKGHVIETENKILEDAFDVSLKGEDTAKDIKATLKEYRQFVKEADRNDFGDIQTKDGGVVTFEKHVEYPAGETTGIVDEAITKHTREQDKKEILTATKFDAQGNVAGTATYINGRIDSLTEFAPNGSINTLQADDKGVLLAKGMKQTETGFQFDEIMNFDYVGDVRRLVSCVKDVKIENGITTIEKAYKFDNDNNLKEYATEIRIGADDDASLARDFQFESDNLVAAASLYNGEISAFGKGVAGEVFTFKDGETVSYERMAEYTINK